MKALGVVALVSVWWWVAALPAQVATRDCQERGPTTTTEGWPVMAAFKMPKISGVEVQLGLSHSHRTHTNITLTYSDKRNGALQLELKVESEVTAGATALLVLVTPDSWNILKVNLHRNKLVVVVMGHSDALNYTTRALIDFPHYRGVDTVTSSCPSTCMIDVDLHCLYDANDKEVVPAGTKATSGTKSSRGTPSWPFFLLAALVLLVLLLFLTWRYQRRQIRRRHRFQAKAEAQRKRMSQGGSSGQRRESVQARNEAWDLSDSVQYSTILKGYDGPCTGDDE